MIASNTSSVGNDALVIQHFSPTTACEASADRTPPTGNEAVGREPQLLMEAVIST